MPSGPSGRATSPAAARTPAWRMPPPTSLRAAARAPDDVARPDEHGADRAAEALAQAERDGVGRVGEVARGHAGRRWATTAFQKRAPSMWSGTPWRVRDGRDLAGVGRRERLAHRVGVGVLDGDEAA